MRRIVVFFCCLLALNVGFSQSQLSWQGYFSYNEIKDVAQSNSNLFAASENALFSKNTLSNTLKTTTTIDGLSGLTISALYHSVAFNKTIVGYENGLLIVINEADGSLLKVVDIINKQLPANIKKINHFMEYQGILYVSCDFGIVQFNLNTQLFGDTYFIGDLGKEISVKQTAVFEGNLYAATENGIRRAAITNPNLIDYKQWTMLLSDNWSGITVFGTDLYASTAAGTIYKYGLSSFSVVQSFGSPIVDLRSDGNNLLVTTPSQISVFGSGLLLVKQVNSNQILDKNPVFTCATIVNTNLFLGTKENGLLTTTLSVGAPITDSTPPGPLRNAIFSFQVTPTALWAVYGGYTGDYNPYSYNNSGPNLYGISRLNTQGWLSIPANEVLGAKSISRVTINPNDETKVYASSFFSGLLRIENEVPNLLYNQTNSGLESIAFLGPTYIDVRINGTAFDKSGSLWVTNSRIENGLKVLRSNGQWQSYSLNSIAEKSIDVSMGRMVIDKNNTKWIASNTDGVIAFNESGTPTFKKITFGADKGNLPTTDVRALAIDTNNQLWIGTNKGLRVLSNVNNFQNTTALTTKPIIILEDEVAQELLFEQFINAIVVDGANNKWVGTADSGVFLLSSNGQKTIYHFTTNNSPLPSNTINDIGINSVTGEVYIATTKGMISFKGVATGASDSLNNVYVYPNPVRPEFSGTVKIAGLLDRANIKITDIEGNLVHEAISEGGTIEWDTTAFGKYKVASGVYMIFISAEDGVETKVKKVMIIR
nr:two-component regulator propeller domain-containing protein [uncultured Flavobacterium sp.]